MILRVEIALTSTLKFETGAPLHVADDTTYLTKLLQASSITKTGNFGDGWRVGNFSFVLDDADGAYRASSEIWYGKPVTVYAYEETESGSVWSLTERARWCGAIAKRSTDDLGRIAIQCAENHGHLGDVIPAYTISSVDYPAAKDSALGQPVQTLTGTYTLSGGAVVAWNVGDNRYLLAQNSVVSVQGSFDPNGGAVISPSLWQLLYDSNGRSLIKYVPEEGTQEPEYLYCNVIATEAGNPIDCLKTTLDLALGTGVFFAGADTVKTEMTSRGYLAAINASMGDEVGDLVDEFCRNFDCFAVVGTDGKLSVGQIDATPAATFTDANIREASETEEPDEAANDVTFAYAYDFPGNKFYSEDNYQHADSVSDYGRHTQKFDYYLTRDRSTAIDITRRRVRQLREIPRTASITVDFSQQQGVEIGDVISVTSGWLIHSGANLYVVRGKTLNWQDNTVTLDCRSYASGMDYIIEVIQLNDGGTISPTGLQVVAAGDNLTVTVTPDAHHSIAYFDVDHGTIVTGETSYTFSAVAADHSISIMFATDEYLIEASDDGNGTISPKGATWVTAGADQTFTYTPKSGKTFLKFIVDGVDVTGSNSYTFEDVAANHTIVGYSTDTVTQYCTVTINKTGTGTVTPKDGGTISVQKGNDVYLNFYPAASTVVVDGVDVTSGNTYGYVFWDIAANHTIAVTWS
jgi:hypothetical protein